MASFTIGVAPWPVGQSVSVYYAEGWTQPSQAPSGVALTSNTVTSLNTVTFSGLPDARKFVAWAVGQGVTFSTPLVGPQAPVSSPDRERIAALEAAVASGGGGGGGGGVTVNAYVGGAYPPRPDGENVMWMGPTPPTIGGAGNAVDGADLWIDTS